MIKIRRNNNQMQNFSSFSILVNENLFSCKICFCSQQGQQFWVMNIRKIDSDENRSLELWSEGKKLFFVEFCPLLIDHQLCEIWVNSKSKRATYEKAYPWKNLHFSILSDEQETRIFKIAIWSQILACIVWFLSNPQIVEASSLSIVLDNWSIEVGDELGKYLEELL